MKSFLRAVLTITFIFAVIPAVAHQGATGIVKERMEVMQEIGKAMKVIGQMVRDKTGYDASTAQSAARKIRNHATRIPGLFPKGSIDGPSEALPVIWESWHEFLSVNDAMMAASDRLAELASGASSADEIRAQFDLVGRSCSACHEKFRLKRQ